VWLVVHLDTKHPKVVYARLGELDRDPLGVRESLSRCVQDMAEPGSDVEDPPQFLAVTGKTLCHTILSDRCGRPRL
jgi:hypothetical protein